MSSRPFFIAKYGGQAAAIRSTMGFTATIASMHKAFPALKLLDSSLIRMSARLDGFGDLLVNINDDVWDVVLPSLTIVEISTEDAAREVATKCHSPHIDKAAEAMAESRSKLNVESKPIVVRVRYKHAKTKDLHLPVLPTTTIQQLKSLIVEHDDRIFPHMMLSYEDHPNLDDSMTLGECGIENKTEVFLSTEFDVYLAGSDDGSEDRVAVTISTFATVSILRTLLEDLSNEGTRYRSFCNYTSHQILSCAGEALRDARKLGSYRQIVPGCEIRVNNVPELARFTATPQEYVTLSVRRTVSSDHRRVETISDLYIPSNSTILDLKMLLSIRCNIPPSAQVLEQEESGDDGPLYYGRRELGDELIIKEQDLDESSDNIWLTGSLD